jgi:hypothetical protein
MITLNVTGMSLRSVHAHLGFKHKVYENRMQDGNITIQVGAQYNQKRLFLEPPPLDCKSKSGEST